MQLPQMLIKPEIQTYEFQQSKPEHLEFPGGI